MNRHSLSGYAGDAIAGRVGNHHFIEYAIYQLVTKSLRLWWREGGVTSLSPGILQSGFVKYKLS